MKSEQCSQKMFDLNKIVQVGTKFFECDICRQVDFKHQYEHLKVNFIIRIGMVLNTWLSGQTESFLLC